MKKVFSLIILLLVLLTVFSGCSGGLMIPSPKTNRQIIAETILDRQSSINNNSLYMYTLTNGNKCIDKVYTFNYNPDDLMVNGDTDFEDIYEDSYLVKYSYLYFSGKRNSDIQVQKSTRDEVEDSPWYCDQFFYFKSQEDKDKIQVYQSYEIGTNGTAYDNDDYYYSYDNTGKLSGITDDNNYTYCLFYDEQGILQEKSYSVTESNYDRKMFSYKIEDENIVIVYVYDAEDGDIINRYEYDYDINGNITKERYYIYREEEEELLYNVLTYTYDDNGNISETVEEQYDVNEKDYDTVSKEYIYDADNNVIKIIRDNGKSVKYTLFFYTDSPAEYSYEY